MIAPRGRLVTLEGGEGTGKSSQVEAIAERARARGVDVVTCREPGGTALGEGLRSALFGLAEPPLPLAELLVFAAARAQLVHDVIRPALATGALVLCDRFTDSTIAYQHYGRGLEADMVEAVTALAVGGLVPDLTVLLDLSPEVGLARGAQTTDYIERADLEFHERVREGYRTLADDGSERWLILDGQRPAVELTGEIWARLAPMVTGML